MRSPMLVVALVVAPAMVSAQASTGAQTEATQEARVAPKIPEGFSVETRARLTALLETARRQNLPAEPMTDRMAEGQAKGAAEVAIVAATAETLAQLEASQSALVRAGREQPTADEVTRGAQLLALRGELALDVLLGLTARGVPVGRALSALETAGPSAVRVTLGAGRKP